MKNVLLMRNGDFALYQESAYNVLRMNSPELFDVDAHVLTEEQYRLAVLMLDAMPAQNKLVEALEDAQGILVERFVNAVKRVGDAVSSVVNPESIARIIKEYKDVQVRYNVILNKIQTQKRTEELMADFHDVSQEVEAIYTELYNTLAVALDRLGVEYDMTELTAAVVNNRIDLLNKYLVILTKEVSNANA